MSEFKKLNRYIKRILLYIKNDDYKIESICRDPVFWLKEIVNSDDSIFFKNEKKVFNRFWENAKEIKHIHDTDHYGDYFSDGGYITGEFSKIIHLPNDSIYIKIDGWWDSYSDFKIYKIYEVTQEEVTKNVYVKK